MRLGIIVTILVLVLLSIGYWSGEVSPQSDQCSNDKIAEVATIQPVVDNKTTWAAIRAEPQVEKVWQTYMVVKVQRITGHDMGKVILSLCGQTATMMPESSCENGNAMVAFVCPYRDIPIGTKPEVFLVGYKTYQGWQTFYLVK